MEYSTILSSERPFSYEAGAVLGWGVSLVGCKVFTPVCLAPNQQQHLIELIRQRETEAALEFAQTQLAEQGEESRECLTEMERTLALLAFDNPEDSPFGDLLNMMQRQKVGSRGLLSTPSVDIQGRISKETAWCVWCDWDTAGRAPHFTCVILGAQGIETLKR